MYHKRDDERVQKEYLASALLQRQTGKGTWVTVGGMSPEKDSCKASSDNVLAVDSNERKRSWSSEQSGDWSRASLLLSTKKDERTAVTITLPSTLPTNANQTSPKRAKPNPSDPSHPLPSPHSTLPEKPQPSKWDRPADAYRATNDPMGVPKRKHKVGFNGAIGKEPPRGPRAAYQHRDPRSPRPAAKTVVSAATLQNFVQPLAPTSTSRPVIPAAAQSAAPRNQVEAPSPASVPPPSTRTRHEQSKEADMAPAVANANSSRPATPSNSPPPIPLPHPGNQEEAPFVKATAQAALSADDPAEVRARAANRPSSPFLTRARRSASPPPPSAQPQIPYEAASSNMEIDVDLTTTLATTIPPSPVKSIAEKQPPPPKTPSADIGAISLIDLEALDLVARASATCSPAIEETRPDSFKRERSASLAQASVSQSRLDGARWLPSPASTPAAGPSVPFARTTSAAPVATRPSATQMQIWIEDGITDINRWNLEDRLTALPSVKLAESIEAAEFIILDLPPGRTATSSAHLAVFTRPLIPLSSHWALFSARQGQVQDVLSYLVFPAPIQMLDTTPSAAPPTIGKVERPSVSRISSASPDPLALVGAEFATRAREVTSEAEDEHEAPRPRKRNTAYGYAIESVSPDPLANDKARRFIEEYQKFRDKHRKWVRIAQAIHEYPADPNDWRRYLVGNLADLQAAGLGEVVPFSQKRARISDVRVSSPVPHAAHEGQPSDSDEASVARRERLRKGSTRQKALAVGVHLQFLKEAFEKLQPKDVNDNTAVYAEAATKTKATDVPRTLMGFLHLHRMNPAAVPGWPFQTKESGKKARAKAQVAAPGEGELKSDNSSELDSLSESNTGEASEEEEEKEEHEVSMAASSGKGEVAAIKPPKISTKATTPAREHHTVAQISTSPTQITVIRGTLSQAAAGESPSLRVAFTEEERREVLLEHLRRWDPAKTPKVKYIKQLAEIHSDRRPHSWYHDYLKMRSYLEARLPVLPKKRVKTPRRVASETSEAEGDQSQKANTSLVTSLSDMDDEDLDDIVLAQHASTLNQSASTNRPSSPAPSSSEAREVSVEANPAKDGAKPAYREFGIERWLTPIEEDDLERFVATRGEDVGWEEIFEQWSDICSAMPFSPKNIQVFVQLIDFDVFEGRIERRREASRKAGAEIKWVSPGECSACEGCSPDLIEGVCFDCRTEEEEAQLLDSGS